MTFGYRAFFFTFSWKNPDKNDIGGLILDIWVPSFFDIFMENFYIQMISDA